MAYFLTDRLKSLELIVSCLNKIKNPTDIIIKGNFKNKGKFSDVFATYFDTKLTNGEKKYFCIKIIPLMEAKDYPHDTRFSIWREIMALRWCTILVKSKITQNLPLIFDYILIRDISHLNPHIDNGTLLKQQRLGIKRYNIILFNELSQMDIRTWTISEPTDKSSINFDIWKKYKNLERKMTSSLIDTIDEGANTETYKNLLQLTNKYHEKYKTEINEIEKTLLMNGKRTTPEWFNAFFQIFSALYVIQTKMNMFHNDLHWGNILVSVSNDKSGYWKYIINGITYYIPNCGFVFKLWDFGLSRSEFFKPMNTWGSNVEPSKIQLMNEQEYNEDYNEIYKKMYQIDVLRINNIAKWCSRDDDDVIHEQLPLDFINNVIKPIQNLSKNNKDTRPHILLADLFGCFRHDKIGKTISNDMANDTLNLNNHPHKNNFKIGQMVAIKYKKGYKIGEINCMIPNQSDYIRVLYNRFTNKTVDVNIKYVYELCKKLKTQYDKEQIRCINTFDLDKEIELKTESLCDCTMVDKENPIVQSIINFVDDYKRAEFIKRLK